MLTNSTLEAVVRQHTNVHAVTFHVTHQKLGLNSVAGWSPRIIACKRYYAGNLFVGHSNIIAKAPAVKPTTRRGLSARSTSDYGWSRNLMCDAPFATPAPMRYTYLNAVRSDSKNASEDTAACRPVVLTFTEGQWPKKTALLPVAIEATAGFSNTGSPRIVEGPPTTGSRM
jgi:hypothetical protein